VATACSVTARRDRTSVGTLVQGCPARTPEEGQNCRGTEGTLKAAPERILIVEDDPDSRTALRCLLEMLGHEVFEAASGEQGIEMAVTRRPDVVLLDIAMPGMDGYEVARRIRSARGGHEPYLIALTGWDRREDERHARAAGFDEFVVKPPDPDRLEAILAAAPGPLLADSTY